jgi:hypothetical protein
VPNLGTALRPCLSSSISGLSRLVEEPPVICDRGGDRLMQEALEQNDELRAAIEQAREMVIRAIAVLDQSGAPADIAAHLDLAVHRMSR